jgi:hypothetical protein
VQDEAPLGAVGPEKIAVFVNHEKLGGDAGGEPPFPLGHDRLRGADDSDGGVVAGLQFNQQLGAARWIGIIGNARDFPAKALWRAGEAGDQIDLDPVAVDLIEFWN